MEKKVASTGLARYLSTLDVWAMAFGVMVGWGAFVMPGTTFLPVAGPVGSVISMLISVVILLIIGGNFSYLMAKSSRTGGVYTYTKDAFGRDHAFLSSWFLCLSYLTIVFLNSTAIFVVVQTLMGETVGSGLFYEIAGNRIYLSEVAVSVGALVIIGFLFVVAKPVLQRVLTALSIILAAGVIVIAAFCLPAALSGGMSPAFGSSGIRGGYAVFSLVILAPWAFVGFEVTSFDTAHFKFPKRKIKWVLVIAILFAAFVYIAMILVSVAAVPDGFSGWSEYFSSLRTLTGVSSVPTFNSARAIMGPAGLVVLTVTALAAILTGIIGAYRATTRVLATMAEDRILSEKFSKTTYSIMFIMVLSIIICLLGRNNLNWFVDLTAFGAIVGFGYTSAAAYKKAKTEGDKKIVVTGLAGLIISACFAAVQLIPHLTAMEAMGSEAFLLLSLWCLLGFLFYWRTLTKSNLSEYSSMSASGVVLFALLVYSAIMWLAKLVVSKESVAEVRSTIVWGGLVLIAMILVGLVVMLYIQSLVRKKHEALEREKIRAVEGSLAKSQFLFNMSHDIRTPMNAIIGYTNLALGEETSPKIKDYLSSIKNSGQHLLSLINDVLEMSRIENGKIELEFAPTNIRTVFDEIYELFIQQMEQKNIDFRIHTGQVQNPYVWCDRKNLNRVLLNLLSNAYKFTPSGGNIAVSLWETAVGEDGYGSYEIRVQDSGIGMSREFVDKMWGAFERERTSTDSGVEGTGLGLAITKNIVDLMGGNIEVLTSPGSGTEIIIRLKFRLADASDMLKEENPQSSEPENPDFTGKRLLLVEDNAVNMDIANMILTQAGFTVETAENGQIALDMVSASQPGYYDAILMDIQMPVMDGYAATRAIRALENESLAQIPILAMTANAFKEDEQAAAEAGMQAHIAKPIDIDKLLSTLAKVMKK